MQQAALNEELKAGSCDLSVYGAQHSVLLRDTAEEEEQRIWLSKRIASWSVKVGELFSGIFWTFFSVLLTWL